MGDSFSRTRRNAIILTSGLSGSSVLTGLISRAGHWTGDVTHKKEYDTYENTQLIELNLQLLRQSGYSGDYTREFSPQVISTISALTGRIDERPYRAFLEKCRAHRPWVWKDPRLWLTIGFWNHLLESDDCRFILLTRDLKQGWVSGTLRRHITTFRWNKKYEESIRHSLLRFLEENRLVHLHITYEDLIAQPQDTIALLNQHLETDLLVNDLAAIYHKPLHKAPRSSLVDYVKAWLIYLNNYSERLDIEKEVLDADRSRYAPKEQGTSNK